MAKKKRSTKQIAATKRLVAFNKSKKGKKRGRPPGSARERAFAKSSVGRGMLVGRFSRASLNKSRIAHADAIDKAHGLKPTSVLMDFLAKAPKHVAELQKIVSHRLASDTRPGARKHAKKAKRGPGRPKKHAKTAKHHRGPGRPKGSKNKKHAKTAKHHRGPGRPKGSKNKTHAHHAKRGPGRPKGSKNKHAKKGKRKLTEGEIEMMSWGMSVGKPRSPKQLKNDARLRAKGEKTRAKKEKALLAQQIKWGKKQHKAAHKSAWQGVTPGFPGMTVFGPATGR